MKTILYHNPNCSKSCAVFDKLGELTPDFEIINYFENKPSKAQIEEILSLLKITAENLVRKNESIFKDHFEGKQLTEDEWIEAMITYPILIERPIIIHGNKAAIGRPIDQVFNLFR